MPTVTPPQKCPWCNRTALAMPLIAHGVRVQPLDPGTLERVCQPPCRDRIRLAVIAVF